MGRRESSVSQSVSQSLSLSSRSYQVRPKVRSWEGAHGGWSDFSGDCREPWMMLNLNCNASYAVSY